jgi:uncharacterized RDD family membrane protein YckC
MRIDTWPASLWRRVCAYLFDIILIVLGVGGVFYVFFGFDDTLREYLARSPGDFEPRLRFIAERTLIRNLSLLIYLVYAAVMESSRLQGTLGKWLLSINVVTVQGESLDVRRAAWRNLSKPLSFFTIIGLLAAFRSPLRQTWHDRLAGTVVVYTPTK